MNSVPNEGLQWTAFPARCASKFAAERDVIGKSHRIARIIK